MSEKIYNLGLVGLGTMGRNLLMNMAGNDFDVAGYDKDLTKVHSLRKESKTIYGAETMEDFISVLERPRRIMLLVPAGKVVDYVLADLSPYLEKGDIVIDGGNSYFKDTQRRQKELLEKGVHFLGIGVSGGAEGARRGPSMMPGGDKKAYGKVKNILEAVAAKVGKQPCVTWLGEGAVGHYVKMVHNGIEYGLMQLLAEAYDLMKRGLVLSNAEIKQVFEDWNGKELQSFLVEITAKIFEQKDTLSKADVIDIILDKGKQKGTGKWTSQEAMDVGVPVPSIDLAVLARAISAFKAKREKAAMVLSGPEMAIGGNKGGFVRRLKNAILFSFVITYAQGMELLRAASQEYGFNLDLEGVARIWRGGCIIRAKLLEDFRRAYKKQSDLSNLLFDERISKIVNRHQKDVRKIVAEATKSGIPIPCLMACLSYYDSYRTARLPMNLVQAQRDFFGAHTYERIDRAGVFHTEWGYLN